MGYDVRPLDARAFLESLTRVLAVALTIAVAVLVVGGHFIKATEVDQQSISTAERLASKARTVSAYEYDSAILMALGAERLRSTPATKAALWSVVTSRPEVRSYIYLGEQIAGDAIAVSPDHRFAAFDVAPIKEGILATNSDSTGHRISIHELAQSSFESDAGSVSLDTSSRDDHVSIAFSPSGKLVAAASGDAMVVALRGSSYSDAARTYHARRGGRFIAIAFATDRILRAVLLTNGHADVEQYDLDSPKASPLGTGIDGILSPSDVALTPDGGLFGVQRPSRIVAVHPGKREELCCFKGDFGALRVSRNGHTVESLTRLSAPPGSPDDGTWIVSIWKPGAHASKALPARSGSQPVVAVSDDGSRVAVAADKTVQVYDTARFDEQRSFRMDAGPPAALTFLPGSHLLAAVTADRGVVFEDAPGNRFARDVLTTKYPIRNLWATHDVTPAYLIVQTTMPANRSRPAGSAFTTYLRTAHGWREVARRAVEGGSVVAAVDNAHTRLAVATGLRKPVEFFAIPTLKTLTPQFARIVDPDAEIISMALDDAGHYLVTSDNAAVTAVWNLSDGSSTATSIAAGYAKYASRFQQFIAGTDSFASEEDGEVMIHPHRSLDAGVLQYLPYVEESATSPNHATAMTIGTQPTRLFMSDHLGRISIYDVGALPGVLSDNAIVATLSKVIASGGLYGTMHQPWVQGLGPAESMVVTDDGALLLTTHARAFAIWDVPSQTLVAGPFERTGAAGVALLDDHTAVVQVESRRIASIDISLRYAKQIACNIVRRDIATNEIEELPVDEYWQGGSVCHFSRALGLPR